MLRYPGIIDIFQPEPGRVHSQIDKWSLIKELEAPKPDGANCGYGRRMIASTMI